MGDLFKDENNEKEARVWWEKASRAGCVNAASRLLGTAGRVKKQKAWSVKEWLTRLAICSHTLRLTDVSAIRAVPEELRLYVLKATREKDDKILMLVGELLYGYVATTEAYAFGKPIFHKEWTAYVKAIDFYLQKTKHLALLWIWMAPQLKIAPGHDVVKLIAKLIFNPKADKRAIL